MRGTDKYCKNESIKVDRASPNINFINKLQDKKNSIIDQVIHSNMIEAPNKI